MIYSLKQAAPPLFVATELRRWSAVACRALLIVVAFGIIGLPPGSAAALDLEDTFLLEVRLGSSRSDIARSMRRGGYELSDGTPVAFDPWYQPQVPDLTLRFLTQLSPDTGVIWGLSTGERGEKYRIDPGLWLGLVHRQPIGRKAAFVFSAMTMLGGNFREGTCTADYGDIGGIQTVNCRLAASLLTPEETLDFLVRERGARETVLSIRYELRF